MQMGLFYRACQVAVLSGLLIAGCGDGYEAECSTAAACGSGACKLPDGVCVECVTNADCTGASTEVCNPEMNTCEGCDAHADCTSSHACDFETGACIDPDQVAHVAAGGTSNASCSLEQPCDSINAALVTGRPIIKFDGTGLVTVSASQTIARDVRILADPGAALRCTDANGPAVGISTGNV